MDTFQQDYTRKTSCPFSYSAAVRQGIVGTVEKALGDPKVKSVVICGQNGTFCGGMGMIVSFLFHHTSQWVQSSTSAIFILTLRWKERKLNVVKKIKNRFN